MNTLEMKSLGIQELDSRDMLEVDGGAIPLLYVIGRVLVAGFIYESINNYDKMIAAVNEGYADGMKAFEKEAK